MVYVLAIVSFIAVFYMVRFYRLKANLRREVRELREIEQNPEESRILRISFPDKEAENFLEAMNAYIMLTRKERIFYKKREKELRAQIENISHDLRTPLTAIIGYMELLDRDSMSPEDREMMDAIFRKAKYLQGLIGNFYDLSRLEMNDYNLHPERLDAARFARETSLLFYQQFEERGLSVQFTTGGKMSDEDSAKTAGMHADTFEITVDSGALERIFNNMLQNALRYAESFLHIDVSRDGGKVCILFENDTTTLKPEDIPHLFERFYVQEKSRTSASSGLGLTISKLLAEAMGGSVEAELKNGRLRIKYQFER